MSYSKNPITTKINEFITLNYLNKFMSEFLPGFEFRITSTTRTEAENKAVDGAKDSAHLYGLAIDGNLISNATGQIIDEMQGRIIFNDYFEPYWDGYAEFSPGTASKRWHIHINIDRGINEYTKWLGIGVAAVMGAFVVRKLAKKKGR